MAKVSDRREVLHGMDRAKWRRWLEDNHDRSSGVWLVVRKKRAEGTGVTLDEATEEALCFGWIDGRLNTLAEDWYKLLFAPRKPESTWARSNKERVRKLIEQGRMTPAGLRTVEIAKQNGSWDRLEDVEELCVPADLENALSSHPPAKENFEAFSASYKKQVLWWIASTKRPETRGPRGWRRRCAWPRRTRRSAGTRERPEAVTILGTRRASAGSTGPDGTSWRGRRSLARS
jgi:uncharacterized protein YdeI (YjbR/CyaY-like superfamily)